MSQTNPSSAKRSKLTPALIAGTFIIGIVIAIIVVKFGLHPSTTKNYGELVNPARPLPQFSLKTVDDRPFSLKDIQHKWSYIYFIDTQCDATCELNLTKMKNARLAQGTETHRVKYYLVMSNKPQQAFVDELTNQFPKLTILYNTGEKLQTFIEVFEHPKGKTIYDAQRVHMVDPIGNYMMYYEPGSEGIGFMEDLKFLLKISQIG
jgi:cytochrome oxidase Cu insertion factor (SCO1/SenC/PrrC family)